MLRIPTPQQCTCKTTKRSPSTSDLTGVPRSVHVWKSWGSCFKGVVTEWNWGPEPWYLLKALSVKAILLSPALFQWQSPLDSPVMEQRKTSAGHTRAHAPLLHRR